MPHVLVTPELDFLCAQITLKWSDVVINRYFKLQSYRAGLGSRRAEPHVFGPVEPEPEPVEEKKELEPERLRKKKQSLGPFINVFSPKIA